MANISINFALARQQAQKLEEAAQRLRHMADSEFENAVQTLEAQWKGEAATAYLRKCELMREKIYEEARNIDHIASSLRRRIHALYEAEQMAKQIAATHGGH